MKAIVIGLFALAFSAVALASHSGNVFVPLPGTTPVIDVLIPDGVDPARNGAVTLVTGQVTCLVQPDGSSQCFVSDTPVDAQWHLRPDKRRRGDLLSPSHGKRSMAESCQEDLPTSSYGLTGSLQPAGDTPNSQVCSQRTKAT